MANKIVAKGPDSNKSTSDRLIRIAHVINANIYSLYEGEGNITINLDGFIENRTNTKLMKELETLYLESGWSKVTFQTWEGFALGYSDGEPVFKITLTE